MRPENPRALGRLELDTVIEPRIARYRAILPVHAVTHFHHVAAFLLETHGAAERWLAAIPRALHEASPRVADRPFSSEMLGALAAELGLRPPAMADLEDRADVVLHEAEAGLRCLIDANVSRRLANENAQGAVDRFLDLVFASLYAGLIGALFRRAADGLHGEEMEKMGAHFLWAVMLFRRFELGERHATTFERYFVRGAAVRGAAKRSANEVAAEEEHVFRFLGALGSFVATEGPRLEEIKTDPRAVTGHSKPWAGALLMDELRRPGAAKRRRES